MPVAAGVGGRHGRRHVRIGKVTQAELLRADESTQANFRLQPL